MNQQKEQLETLSEIRSLMERSTRFISLSGLSGVFIGIFAILGAIPVIKYFGFGISFKEFQHYALDESGYVNYSFYLGLFGDAVLVLFLSIFTSVLLTIRKARKKGQPYFDKTAKRMISNLFIPLIAGGIFLLVLMFHGQYSLLPAVTLLFYGLGLLNASKYTLNDIRYLGICEIVLGLVSSYFTRYSMIFWVTGFGILHIIYGMVMYFKYER